MKAILIDSTARVVCEVEIDRELKSLQELVGGYIELVRISDKDDCYVNEEGLLHGEQNFFEYEGFLRPLAGNGVIVGVGRNGKSAPTTLTAEEVAGRVTFMDRRTALDIAVERGL